MPTAKFKIIYRHSCSRNSLLANFYVVYVILLACNAKIAPIALNALNMHTHRQCRPPCPHNPRRPHTGHNIFKTYDFATLSASTAPLKLPSPPAFKTVVGAAIVQPHLRITAAYDTHDSCCLCHVAVDVM